MRGSVTRIPLERRHTVAVLRDTWPTCHVATRLETHSTSGLGQSSSCHVLATDTTRNTILLVFLLPQGEDLLLVEEEGRPPLEEEDLRLPQEPDSGVRGFIRESIFFWA